MSVIFYDIHTLANIYAIATSDGRSEDRGAVAECLATFSDANAQAFNANYSPRLTQARDAITAADVEWMAVRLRKSRGGRAVDWREFAGLIALMRYNADATTAELLEAILVVTSRVLTASRDAP
jgi:hypothetical protein